MSGLEVVASVAGITSLGIQIGNGMLKLKALRDSMRDAPEEIKRLIEEMEIVGGVLREITLAHNNTQVSHLPASSAAQDSLALCQRTTELLCKLISDLDASIGKRKIVGSIKAILKQDVINRLKENLRSAQFLLILSRQTSIE